MTLTSMTGFARAEGEGEGLRCVWELRSVNGKGLDIRLRLPVGFEGIEVEARRRLQKALSRGNVSATLSVQKDLAQLAPNINADLLDHYAEAAKSLVDRQPHIQLPRADGLLALRGVVETSDEIGDRDQEARRSAMVLGVLDESIESLVAARAEEGRRTTDVIAEMVGQIAALSEDAASAVVDQRDVLRQRLSDAVHELMDASSAIAPERLEQEVALLYTKADVREELDRLATHLEQARELLAADAAVGRRFDFLCQEFNREANTLCSKAAIGDLSRIGLDLKIIIDQLREQVQNIE